MVNNHDKQDFYVLVCGRVVDTETSFNPICITLSGDGQDDQILSNHQQLHASMLVGSAFLVIDHGASLWVTGGWLNGTTKILTFQQSSEPEVKPGPPLPHGSALRHHCLVKVGAKDAIISGGLGTNPLVNLASPMYWSFNFDTVSWKFVRNMITARAKHSCGVLADPALPGSSVKIIVAAGGEAKQLHFPNNLGPLDSVELLIKDGSSYYTEQGPDLPVPIMYASSATTADQQDMFLIGGLTNDNDDGNTRPLDSVYRLSCFDLVCSWTTVDHGFKDLASSGRGLVMFLPTTDPMASMNAGMIVTPATTTTREPTTLICLFGGDQECDGKINDQECLYDGGDCCLQPSVCNYCIGIDCICHETGLSHCEVH